MILDFIVEEDIRRKTQTPIKIDKNEKYYKCIFDIDESIWQDEYLIVTFKNAKGYTEDVHLGPYQEKLSCVVPLHFLLGSYFNMYIKTKNDIRTNTISIVLKNNFPTPPKKCHIVSDIFKEIDKKIDTIVFENNQILCYSDDKLIDTIYISIDQSVIEEIVSDELRNIVENEIQEQIEKEEYIKRDKFVFEDGILYF
jgi:hypothetical protein